jgi:hypothetical protein
LSLVLKDKELDNSEQESIEILKGDEVIMLPAFSSSESKVEEPNLIKEAKRIEMVQRQFTYGDKEE